MYPISGRLHLTLVWGVSDLNPVHMFETSTIQPYALIIDSLDERLPCNGPVFCGSLSLGPPVSELVPAEVLEFRTGI